MNRNYLRDYPKIEEPKVYNCFEYDPSRLQAYRNDITEFFQKLGLDTTQRSIEGKEFIEGSFRDKKNRLISLRFFLKGCYKNVQIEGDPYTRDIRMFKTLYRESPYIKII